MPTDPDKTATDQQILQFMTTEHSALETARSGTIFDASGRTSVYLGALSSVIVALAFIGQMTQLGQAFVILALILLPSVLFIGIVTFVRVLDVSIEDLFYARGIARIRHYYVEIAPHMKDYFVMSTHDDMAGMLHDMSKHPSFFQIFLATAGLVSVLNSTLAGVIGGLVGVAFFGAGLALSVIVGLAIFAVTLLVQTRYQLGRWNAANQKVKPMFPSE